MVDERVEERALVAGEAGGSMVVLCKSSGIFWWIVLLWLAIRADDVPPCITVYCASQLLLRWGTHVRVLESAV